MGGLYPTLLYPVLKSVGRVKWLKALPLQEAAKDELDEKRGMLKELDATYVAK